jgi:plasmid stabilization system protein ParE
LRRFTVLHAPRLDDDVEKHVEHLRTLEEAGEIGAGYAESWFSMFEEALVGLGTLAERHPYAPERQAWGRDVRNALFADYRILYLVVGEHVWAMRVRHQRQAQLRRPGPGTAYAPPR